MKSLCLIGPGAVGCTLLAWLARADRRLAVAARTAFDRIEVDTPQGRRSVSPEVWLRPEQARPVDWVLLATKAYDVPGTLPWLDRLVGPTTRVAILQNGVDHLDRLPARFLREQLLPVMVDCPAERLGPGRVWQRGVARLVVPDGAGGREWVQLFNGTSVEASVSADWVTVAWHKLCLNAAGAVSAVTALPAGVVQHAPAAELMRSVVREVIAVGRREGAQLADARVEEVIESTRAAPADAVNSLLGDRLAGRPMEIDARNGVIVRLGRKHGVPTPYNEAMVALLSTLQAAGALAQPFKVQPSR